jgi:type II secretion system protein I
MNNSEFGIHPALAMPLESARYSRNSEGKTKCPHSGGFTFLEVMVAVSILSMVLVTLIGLENRSMQDVRLAEHITTATMLANGKMMETIMSKKFDPVEEEGEFPDEGNLADYTWKRTISKIPLPNGSLLTEVRVAALWKEGTRLEMVELLDYE